LAIATEADGRARNDMKICIALKREGAGDVLPGRYDDAVSTTGMPGGDGLTEGFNAIALGKWLPLRSE
jgi:hypothetical protein